MIRHTRLTLIISLLVISLFGAAMHAYAAAAFGIMSIDELKDRLDDPGVMILDVRLTRSWAETKLKIKGAIRVGPSEVAGAVKVYDKDKTLVFYCA